MKRGMFLSLTAALTLALALPACGTPQRPDDPPPTAPPNDTPPDEARKCCYTVFNCPLDWDYCPEVKGQSASETGGELTEEQQLAEHQWLFQWGQGSRSHQLQEVTTTR